MTVNETTVAFLKTILGEDDGYFCYSSRIKRTGEWHDHFISLSDLNDFPKQVERLSSQGDLYFCPTPLREPTIVKTSIERSWCLWADADTCEPSKFRIPPSIVVQTSEGRWQCYWALKQSIHALDAEQYNKRIAYAHADEGCDKSGWDLTQRLRVPGSTNFKRFPILQYVEIQQSDFVQYELSDFDVYEPVEMADTASEPMPTDWPDTTPEDIFDQFRMSISPRAWNLFVQAPERDWSKNMWQLLLLLMDVGATNEEAFVVAKHAACNKYERDRRSDDLLWKEILRARKHYEGPPVVVKESDNQINIDDLPILTEEEREWASTQDSFVERYVSWARTIGDASWQYHQAGAFVILSALLCGVVRLPTSFGTVHPNVWFMILADTTLTRKSTAMDLAMDFLIEIDTDVVLATDGSIEGLMTGLSTRPNRPSIFLRDEFSGLLEAVQKKDYYAGMLETLTKLYDGKYQKKILRKESIEVADPRLIIFAGGIRERILQLLSFDHVSSGFMPRFLFITAESDVNKLRPLGPPTEKSLQGRSDLMNHCWAIYKHYHQLSDDPLSVNFSTEAKLEDDAWVYYNATEARMLDIALQSNMPDLLTPTFDRMCKSGLKLALLIAAERMDGHIVVSKQDLVQAFYYIEQWKVHALNVISGIGTTTEERLLERVYGFVLSNPGTTRSRVMQQFKLNARNMDNVVITLEQRQLITRQREGKGERYTAMLPL